MSIAISGHYFENAITEFQNGDIESTTTEVEDDDFFIFFGFETISESGCGWLINNTLDFEASDFAGVFGGLALRIVEISRYGNNSFSDRFAKESFSVSFDFGKHHSGDFFWCIFFAVHFYRNTITLFDDFVWADF